MSQVIFNSSNALLTIPFIFSQCGRTKETAIVLTDNDDTSNGEPFDSEEDFPATWFTEGLVQKAESPLRIVKAKKYR